MSEKMFEKIFREDLCEGLRIHLDSEVHRDCYGDEEVLDTVVTFEGEATIEGPRRQEFLEKIREIFNEYRI